jgi:hypothetical protein
MYVVLDVKFVNFFLGFIRNWLNVLGIETYLLKKMYVCCVRC